MDTVEKNFISLKKSLEDYSDSVPSLENIITTNLSLTNIAKLVSEIIRNISPEYSIILEEAIGILIHEETKNIKNRYDFEGVNKENEMLSDVLKDYKKENSELRSYLSEISLTLYSDFDDDDVDVDNLKRALHREKMDHRVEVFDQQKKVNQLRMDLENERKKVRSLNDSIERMKRDSRLMDADINTKELNDRLTRFKEKYNSLKTKYNDLKNEMHMREFNDFSFKTKALYCQDNELLGELGDKNRQLMEENRGLSEEKKEIENKYYTIVDENNHLKDELQKLNKEIQGYIEENKSIKQELCNGPEELNNDGPVYSEDENALLRNILNSVSRFNPDIKLGDIPDFIEKNLTIINGESGRRSCSSYKGNKAVNAELLNYVNNLTELFLDILDKGDFTRKHLIEIIPEVEDVKNKKRIVNSINTAVNSLMSMESLDQKCKGYSIANLLNQKINELSFMSPAELSLCTIMSITVDRFRSIYRRIMDELYHIKRALNLKCPDYELPSKIEDTIKSLLKKMPLKKKLNMTHPSITVSIENDDSSNSLNQQNDNNTQITKKSRTSLDPASLDRFRSYFQFTADSFEEINTSLMEKEMQVNSLSQDMTDLSIQNLNLEKKNSTLKARIEILEKKYNSCKESILFFKDDLNSRDSKILELCALLESKDKYYAKLFDDKFESLRIEYERELKKYRKIHENDKLKLNSEIDAKDKEIINLKIKLKKVKKREQDVETQYRLLIAEIGAKKTVLENDLFLLKQQYGIVE